MVAGGTTHLPGNVALMSACGGTSQNITEPDYKYVAAYPWTPGVKLPHLEPNAMLEKFTSRAMINASDARLKNVHRAVMADHLLTAETEALLPCECQFIKRNWWQALGRVP